VTPFTTISELLFKRLQAGLSEQEEGLLNAWLGESEHHRAFFAETEDEDRLRAMILTFERLQMQESEQRVLDRLTDQFFPVYRMHITKTAWFRAVAAAIFILIIGSVAYLWKTQPHLPALVTTNPAPMRNDVAAPSRNRATLTLAGGQQVVIDSAVNGTFAVQGNVHIQKMNGGRIEYKGSNVNDDIQYNTLNVPRGSQIASIVLADGSKIFLNSGSSLKYPVAFRGNERKVEITGEAYFEIAKDPKKKFIVSGGGITAEVIGTHFNVNSYSDEENPKVTLIEGSVRVTGGASHLIIKPGAQAVFANGVLQVNQSVNVDQVMAWRNGVFTFENKTLQQVMRELARWYDLTITYENNIPNIKLRGEMGRNLNLSQVLKGLKAMEVNCELKPGKKLLVLQ
jgi:transmembrane sensor